MLNHSGHDCVAAIRARRLLDRDMSNSALVIAPKGTRSEIGLKFAKVLPAGFFTPRVPRELCCLASDLCGDEGEHIGGRRFVDAGHTTGKPQIGEVHGKSEPVGDAPPLAHQRQVFGRERVVAHDRRRVRWWIEQRGARLRREDITRGHVLFGFTDTTIN